MYTIYSDLYRKYTRALTFENWSDDVVESESHLVSLHLPVGTHCMTLHAVNADAETVGPGDVLCVRVVLPQQVALGGVYLSVYLSIY